MWSMSSKTSSTRSKNSAVSSRQARSRKLEASKLACSNAAVQRSKSLHCCKPDYLLASPKPDYLLASPKPYYRSRRHNSSQYSRFHSQHHNMANGYYFPNDDDSDDDEHSYPDGSHFLNLNTSSHKLFYEFMNNDMPGTGNESSQASRSKQASSSTDSSVEQVYRHHEMALPCSPGGNYGRQNSAPVVAFNDHSRGNPRRFSSSSSSSPSAASKISPGSQKHASRESNNLVYASSFFGNAFNFDVADFEQAVRDLAPTTESRRTSTVASGGSSSVLHGAQHRQSYSSRSQSVYKDSTKEYQKLIEKSSPNKLKQMQYKFSIVQQNACPPLYLEPSDGEDEDAPKKKKKIHRILILGSSLCGKTSLIEQFYECKSSLANAGWLGPSGDERQTLYLHFCEADIDASQLGWLLTEYKADVYLILFSISCRDSFVNVRHTLDELQRWDDIEMKNVLIVANKLDLVRSRCVSRKEACTLAESRCCKYVEVSCSLSYNIESLLQGIGTQISLKEKQIEKMKAKDLTFADLQKRRHGFFKRLLRKTFNRSKSCDNLHVL